MRHCILFLISISLFLTSFSQKRTYYSEDFRQLPSSAGAEYVEVGKASSGEYKKELYLIEDSILLSESWYKGENEAKGYNSIESKSYYEDGTLKSHTNKRNGYRNLMVQMYYPNGNLRFKSQREGFRNNTLESYFSDGSLKSKKIEDKKGVKIDEAYYPDGSKKRSTIWTKQGLQAWKIYHSPAKPWLTAALDESKLKVPIQPIQWLFPSGAKIAEVSFESDSKSYRTKVFKKNGEGAFPADSRALDSTLMFNLVNKNVLAHVNFGDTLDTEAVPINMDEVKNFIGYPQLARDKGIQGTVVVRVLVDEQGNVRFFYPIMAVYPTLDYAVFSYIMDLEFEAGSKDGYAMPQWVNIPFNFKLLD